MQQLVAEGGPDANAVFGTRTFLTLLFSDLCGSTRLAASLDADDYAALIEQVRTAAAFHIEQHSGQIVQIYGDGFLAIFSEAHSSSNAIAAARALHSAVGSIRMPAGAATARLLMHSGVHAGLVLLRPGDATRGRMEAIGRPTGIAARLAAAARPDEILVSRGTLGPEGRSLPLGSLRPVQVSDTSDIVMAVPVLGQTIAVAGTGTLPARRERVFVGRAEQLAEVDGWFATPPGDLPSLFAVSAPAGQGKSHLSEEIARRAAAKGMPVVRGTADPDVTSSALLPFVQIDAQIRDLVVPDGSVSTTGPQDQTAQAMMGRMVGLGKAGRFLIVLDDWQWADSASVELLNRLLGSACPALVLMLSRTEELARPTPPAGRTMELPPLELAETTALVQAIRPELDPLDAMRIHEQAGGNPLFVEELCQLPVRALRQPLGSRQEGDEIGWLSTLIGERLKTLPVESLAVLHAAAAIGQECPLWLLATLTGVAADAEQLVTLQEAELLIPSLTPGSLRFKHGITWDVVYRHIPREQRTALHAGLAAIVESHTGPLDFDRDEALARHYRNSASPARAAVHYERAGDSAARVGSADRAQSQYGAALDALEEMADAEIDRALYCKLLAKYGFSCIFDSDEPQLLRLARAGARVGKWGDRETQASAEQWSAYVQHGLGRQILAAEHCRRAINLCQQPPDSPFQVQLRGVLGQMLVAAGRYADGLPLLDEAIAIKRTHRTGRNSSSGLAYALCLKASFLGDTGRFAEAHAMIDEALFVLGSEPNPVKASVASWSCVFRAWQGDWEGLVRATGEAGELARLTGAVLQHATSRAWGAFGRWKLLGDAKSVNEMLSAVSCLEDQGKGLTISVVYGQLAEMLADRGDRPGTHGALASAYRRARLGEPFGVSQAQRAWARMLIESDPYRADLFLRRARATAQRRKSLPELARCDLAEAKLGLVPDRVAFELAERALEGFEQMGMATSAAEARAFLAPTVRFAGATAARSSRTAAR